MKECILIQKYILEKLYSDCEDKLKLSDYIILLEAAIAETRKRYPTIDARYKYYEAHHILPKSIYPELSTSKDNVVLLTAEEHFTAHRILTYLFPGPKMTYAFRRMCICNSKKCEVTAEDYAYSRELNAKYPPAKGLVLSDESKLLISKKSKEFWSRGGYKHTPDQDKKMVETRRANGSYHRSAELNEKVSNSMRGRIFINNGNTNKFIYPDELDSYLELGWKRGKKPLSEEHKRKIGESGKGRTGWNKGKDGPFKGKTHTEEAKQKMRDAKRRSNEK